MENRCRQILRQSGFKCTPGREGLLKTLIDSGQPLTIREIRERMQNTNELTDASIYRALKAFMEAGIVHLVKTEERNWRFALCSCGSPNHCHPHFSCRVCGRTECLLGYGIPELETSPPGYTVEGKEYYLSGLCPDCAD